MATATQRIDLAVMPASSPDVELQTVPVVAALERGQAAEELQTDQAAVLEHAPAAVLARAIDRVVVRAQLIVRAVAELEHGQAVAELEHGQAVAELEHGQAVGELQHVPVVAVPVLGHRHAQPEARRGTRSVTVPHHRGLVPHLVAEDLAAAAETTREPAAAEAIRA
jgi:hypothetical protein